MRIKQAFFLPGLSCVNFGRYSGWNTAKEEAPPRRPVDTLLWLGLGQDFGPGRERQPTPRSSPNALDLHGSNGVRHFTVAPFSSSLSLFFDGASFLVLVFVFSDQRSKVVLESAVSGVSTNQRG